MITTERLFIFPISNEELQMKIEEELDKEMKKAYSEMLAGCIKFPRQHIWYTVWLIQLNDGTKQIIGDLCFKGLNADGGIEIGYGIKPEYEGRGLATEAVRAMAKWASTQPGIFRVEAETEPSNIASQRVLQKSGFVLALANIFETSIDLLIGMNIIRAEETRYNIHKTAHEIVNKEFIYV